MTGGFGRILRMLSATVLGAIVAAGLLADLIAPWPYERQFREFTNAPPSSQFPLGTDDLGRDRFSRLLHGTRISLLLAVVAAVLATAAAAIIGGLAGYYGGRWDRVVTDGTDLMLSLPWLFVLLTVRAMLPLDVAPAASVAITFALLGLLDWAGPARIVRTGVRETLDSAFVLAARSRGLARPRILLYHVLPHLVPVLTAQFWISIPIFILAEANLGMLGLGVTEPLPSWGGLLRELESQSTAILSLSVPLWLLAPVGVLLAVVGCFQILSTTEVTS
ncbi:MAG: ABC transporter permease [Bryobacteraceae bacterium]